MICLGIVERFDVLEGHALRERTVGIDYRINPQRIGVRVGTRKTVNNVVVRSRKHYPFKRLCKLNKGRPWVLAPLKSPHAMPNVLER